MFRRWIKRTSTVQPTIDSDATGSLLTPRALYYTIKVFRLGQQFGCHPYVWNDYEGRAELTKSKIQLAAWLMTAAVSVGYFAFLVTQCFRQASGSDGRFDPILAFSIFIFALPVFLHLNIVISLADLPAFLNTYIRYNKTFQDRYVCKSCAPRKLASVGELIIVITYYSFMLDLTAVWITLFFRANGPEQVTSLLGASMWHPGRLAYFALFVWFEAGFYVNACMSAVTHFGFFFSAFQMLDEFGQSSGKFTVLRLQDPDQLVHVYRVLVLQVNQANAACRVIIAATKFLLMTLTILCIYGGIRLHGVTSAALGALGGSLFIFLVMMISIWSKLDTESKKVLRHLRRIQGQGDSQSRGAYNIVRRQIATLRPFGITIFRMYVADKPLVLTVIKTICEQVTALLVNY